MADLTFFQETTINDFDTFTPNGYFTPSGEARWTEVEFEKNNNLAFRINNIDISEQEALDYGSVADYLTGADNIYGMDQGDNFLMGFDKGDFIEGGFDNDFIHGNHGPDRLFGRLGDDEIRGGHGHDILDGSAGADYLWGGVGKNKVYAGNDFDRDRIFVPADSAIIINPDGVNSDILYEVWPEDEIFIHGVDNADLSFQAGILDPGGTNAVGIGIFANDTLEAIVVNPNVNITQVENMTTGGFFA